MRKKVDLSKFNNNWYNPGPILKRILWYFVNELILKNTLVPSSDLKIWFLRIFGARVGKNSIIKPGVNIKYPWKLIIGNNCWIGENVWIDNLDNITIQDNVCISQGAMLLCGNHNYKKQSFNLIIAPICLKEGSWIGAKSIVCPGITLNSHSILSLGSVATKDLDEYSIYKGNPAVKIGERNIEL